MPFKLWIKFEFLCLFVPDHPFEPGGPQATNTKVLLRDLRQPPAQFLNQFRAQVPDPHIAHLQFNNKNRVADASDRAADDREGEDQRIILLDGDQITIRPDGRDPLTDRLKAKVGVPVGEPPNEAEKEYLWWLPKLRDLAPGREKIKPELLTGAGPHDPALAARVNLGEGVLFTHEVTDSRSTYPLGLTRRVALSVAYVLKDINEFVDIQFSSFDGTAKNRLRLKPVVNSRWVFLHIRNSEQRHLFGDLRSPPYGFPDLDFEHYYAMSEGFTPSAPRPIPIGPNPDSGHSACSPGEGGG